MYFYDGKKAHKNEGCRKNENIRKQHLENGITIKFDNTRPTKRRIAGE